ncbi:unnamed protein product [Sphenostylis stenocarpa]|uniref:Uncharacterized protein n=1 Tax=Sphenostylis stenocarpa TaxID=92480 RepID=A0AA86SJ03_9FABA|nr:unnamed protein product [Sphenostylis stenocarpa]
MELGYGSVYSKSTNPCPHPKLRRMNSLFVKILLHIGGGMGKKTEEYREKKQGGSRIEAEEITEKKDFKNGMRLSGAYSWEERSMQYPALESNDEDYYHF